MIPKVQDQDVRRFPENGDGENGCTAERKKEDIPAGMSAGILLPELFKTPYFCQKENYDYFNLAEEYEDSQ